MNITMTHRSKILSQNEHVLKSSSCIFLTWHSLSFVPPTCVQNLQANCCMLDCCTHLEMQVGTHSKCQLTFTAHFSNILYIMLAQAATSHKMLQLFLKTPNIFDKYGELHFFCNVYLLISCPFSCLQQTLFICLFLSVLQQNHQAQIREN